MLNLTDIVERPAGRPADSFYDGSARWCLARLASAAPRGEIGPAPAFTPHAEDDVAQNCEVAPLAQGSVRRSAEFDGVRVMECVYEANTALPMHVHEHPYLTLALEGVYEETWHGGSYEFRPGSLMVRPAGTDHSDCFGSAGGRCMVVDIPADSFVGSRISAVRHLDHGPVLAAARRIHHELRCPDSVTGMVVDGLLLQILGLLRRHASDRPRGGRPPDWLRRAHERLSDEFLTPPDTADLASEAGVHPDHFIRAFREEYGETPGRWVRARRLDWAAARLRNTDDSLSSIGLRAGFCDQSHFSRAFRSEFGVPPGRYRQSV